MAEAATDTTQLLHFTRAAGFCPARVATTAASETNFAPCRSAATAMLTYSLDLEIVPPPVLE
jgi:hypothetical protein